MTNRAAMVRQEFRYQEVSDGTTQSLYKHADVVELPTNMDATSASGLAATILAALKGHAMAWEVEIDGILNLEDFDLTVNQYTLSAPLYSTDNRTYKLVNADIDYVNNVTTLRIRG
jgi:predicted nicotinamide N-methyase